MDISAIQASKAEQALVEQVRDVPRPLVEQYGEPPFSTLDTTSERWQRRRAAWLALGIEPGLVEGVQEVLRVIHCLADAGKAEEWWASVPEHLREQVSRAVSGPAGAFVVRLRELSRSPADPSE